MLRAEDRVPDSVECSAVTGMLSCSAVRREEGGAALLPLERLSSPVGASVRRSERSDLHNHCA